MPIFQLTLKALRAAALVTHWLCVKVVLVALSTCFKGAAIAVLPHAFLVDYFVDAMCRREMKLANACNSHLLPLAGVMTARTACAVA